MISAGSGNPATRGLRNDLVEYHQLRNPADREGGGSSERGSGIEKDGVREADPEIDGSSDRRNPICFARNMGNQDQGYKNWEVLNGVLMRPVCTPNMGRQFRLRQFFIVGGRVRANRTHTHDNKRNP